MGPSCILGFSEATEARALEDVLVPCKEHLFPLVLLFSDHFLRTPKTPSPHPHVLHAAQPSHQDSWPESLSLLDRHAQVFCIKAHLEGIRAMSPHAGPLPGTRANWQPHTGRGGSCSMHFFLLKGIQEKLMERIVGVLCSVSLSAFLLLLGSNTPPHLTFKAFHNPAPAHLSSFIYYNIIIMLASLLFLTHDMPSLISMPLA